ncbi:Zinc finger SWIM domain-containing protein 7 [Amphibalanus amphitrite]|uniref:Zinc finger SWIM domain-containing protein 7 n=1 Tax=Amphibalanus amphitrite TaxID=1232801 RepID=A0A6A4WXZ2_AMPAM|nr:Zinc finger SWIM domain-containing protein 7 [Amphibalanus amphitrite]
MNWAWPCVWPEDCSADAGSEPRAPDRPADGAARAAGGARPAPPAMLDVLSVLDCLVEQVGAARERHQPASDELLLALQAVAPALLEPALDLIDRSAVSRLVAPAGRAVYRVLGSGGVPYYCPQPLTFCPCPAFQYTVLQRGDQPLCKHLLAAKLAQALGKCADTAVSDPHLRDLLTELH